MDFERLEGVYKGMNDSPVFCDKDVLDSPGSEIASRLVGYIPVVRKPDAMFLLVMESRQAVLNNCENVLRVTTTPGFSER